MLFVNAGMRSSAISKCRFCNWLCKKLQAGCNPHYESFWDYVTVWERDASNEWELWTTLPEDVQERTLRAVELKKTDPEAAFPELLELADAGGVWAMEVVGHCYQYGAGVEPNFGQSQEYYYRAISAGSWMATISYGYLLAKHDHWKYVDMYLGQGVEADFAPAAFWLAWLRYKRDKSRRTCREVRPLLEQAMALGHPGAKVLLGRMMLLGKFGLRDIRPGWRLLREAGREFAKAPPRVRSEGPIQEFSAAA